MTVAGNRIGVTADGRAAGGGFAGVIVNNATTADRTNGVVVGGPALRDRNVVADCTTFGIYVETANDVTVQNNYVGTNAAGTAAVPNTGDGITVNSDSRSVRVVGNLVSGNTGAGVNLDSTVNTYFRGNKVGVTAAGTAKLPNGGAGVLVQSVREGAVGGFLSSERNVISGNGGAGVVVRNGAQAVLVVGNAIGTAAGGTLNLGNGGDGVAVSAGASIVWVGYDTDPTANVIAYNAGAGVSVSDPTATRVSVRRNSIHDNGGLGIDLVSGGRGVTPNDDRDPDAGPNDLQNYPTFAAQAFVLGGDGFLTAAGTLNSTPNRQFAVDLYAGPAADPSGFGEGRRYLGGVTVNTDAAGNATFSFRTARAYQVSAGEDVTATATDTTTGSTSEFSRAVFVTQILAKGAAPAVAAPLAAAPLGSPAAADGSPNAWVVSLPAVGTLTLGGAPVVVNQVIPLTSLDRLVYAAPAGTAEPASEFTYRLGVPDVGDTPGRFGDTDFTEAGTDLQTVVSEIDVPAAGTAGAPVFLAAGDDDLDAAATFVWTVTAPDGSSFTLTGGVAGFTPTAAGTYTVDLTATDDRGVSETRTATTAVTAGPLPPPPPPAALPDTAAGSEAGSPAVVTLTDPTGAVVLRFTAYEDTFLGGVNVATGDLTGDGVPDVVTGPGAGGGPVVKVFDGATGELVRSFMAFDPSFRGGVSVAVADVTGDGFPDIVVGAGPGGGPHVEVFDGATGELVASFYAYDPSFTGGVSVAAADLDGDGKAEVLTAPGAGGGPAVKVFYGGTLAEAASFFGGDPADRSDRRVELARDPDTGRVSLSLRSGTTTVPVTDDLTLPAARPL